MALHNPGGIAYRASSVIGDSTTVTRPYGAIETKPVRLLHRKALGLIIRRSMLARANEVIEWRTNVRYACCGRLLPPARHERGNYA